MTNKIEGLIYETAETLDEAATVYEAAELMAEGNLGFVLVTRREKIIGLFTERDMINRVIGLRRDPGETLLGDICTRNLVSINADASCENAIKMMGANKCRRLLVYRNDIFQGLVSLPQVAQAMATGGRSDLAVNLVFAASLSVIIGAIILLTSHLPDVMNLAEKTM
ncbi:MAG: CBS domain-containing protein [Gammaproteobacteria bacterium]